MNLLKRLIRGGLVKTGVLPRLQALKLSVERQYVQKDWDLTDVEPLSDEGHTSVTYKARQLDGAPAVLKQFKSKGSRLDEEDGARLLDYYNGVGAVKVLREKQNIILLEYLNGENLEQLSLSGRDNEATDILCNIVKTLHADKETDSPKTLRPLETQFSMLLSLPDDTNDDMALEARDIVQDLLDTTETVKPLHGDLHGLNVLNSTRGWLAIDPKAVEGDPCYEFSSAYRFLSKSHYSNLDTTRINGLTEKFSDALGYSPERIAKFAFARNMNWASWQGFGEDNCAYSREVAKQIKLQF